MVRGKRADRPAAGGSDEDAGGDFAAARDTQQLEPVGGFGRLALWRA